MLHGDDISALRSVCRELLYFDNLEDAEAYNLDWMRKWRGSSRCVALPESTEEVCGVLRYCNSRQLAVVPQGGKTGLVGGSVPVKDEIVLCTRRMRAIESFDEDSGIIRVQAGCVLVDVDDFLRKRGFAAPLDLAASGTCTIGGNASTNAGGVRFLRYGSLRGSIVGLEVVLADGTVLDAGYSTALRKDNTGLALHQLFLGAEGSLGVITKVAIAAPAASNAVHVALFACKTFDDVRGVLAAARSHCAEILSAVEFFDAAAARCVLANEPSLRDPLVESPFRVLIETSGSRHDHDREKLDGLVAHLLDTRMVLDGVVADTNTKARDLWRIREGISDAMTNMGTIFKYDLSLPLKRMYDLVDMTRERCPPDVTVAGYGHLADANLHLNVCSPRKSSDTALLHILEPWVFDQTIQLRGSISAEHGLGRCKNEYLHLNKSPAALDIMRSLKFKFDPQHILNPFKFLPTS